MRGLPCLWTQSKCGGVTQDYWGDLRLGLRKTFVRALLDPWVEEPRAQGCVRVSYPHFMIPLLKRWDSRAGGDQHGLGPRWTDGQEEISVGKGSG